ncbi:MAG: hypothetical protein HON90_04340 [Halobacteriovoraceae bacterium]|nr:hypothetical protein [Halobacteriovoraceae bacterium]
MTSILILIATFALISCETTAPHYQDLFAGNSNNTTVVPAPAAPEPEKVVEAVIPDFINKEGCSVLYPQAKDDVVAVVQRESGESYILYEGGSFVEGDISDINFGDVPLCDNDELLINGSFEQGHNLGDNEWGLFNNLPGWYANIPVKNAGIEVQNGDGIGGIMASDGSAKVELDAVASQGYTKSDVYLVQDFIAPKESVFVLQFDYSARINGDNLTNRAYVYWNGQKVANLNSQSVGWNHFAIAVNSISDFQRLEFRSRNDADSVGGYIDNVSVRQVCE